MNRRVDAVVVVKPIHLHIFRLAVRSLQKHADVDTIHVVVNHRYFAELRRLLPNLSLIDEDKLIPTVTLAGLRELKVHGFPRMAGWYFQQLLKLGAAFHPDVSRHYLVWDADTILLRPLEFFEGDTMLLTRATEHHPPYFNFYRKALGADPNREFSFIAQHMLFDKALVQEMLKRIEMRLPGDGNWAWKIMNNLDGVNERLSEYELYGHYVKNHHRDAVEFRDLPWLREGSQVASYFPTERHLASLAERYVYASFEYRPRSLTQKVLTRLRVRWLRMYLAIRAKRFVQGIQHEASVP